MPRIGIFFFFARSVKRTEGNTTWQQRGGMPCFLNSTVVPSNDSWCRYIPFSLVLIDVEVAELGKVSKPLALTAH